jgi:hypothetical protein
MNRFPRLAAFLAGLAALGWVGAGYVGGNPLALGLTALIGAFYVLGALDLERFRRATAGLQAAVAGLDVPLPELAAWLERLDPALRPAVRRRIDGEAAALPGPTLAPYLAGLLVLLGMLGTFLGMVLTLRGTGIALENATDLQVVRSSLVAPVKGLGLAFGTSVAGVATSAMLGLMAALARRERALAAQGLDARIAGTLRPHSGAHRRAASFAALQRQADLLPTLVDRVQAMMEAMERRAEAADARLLARQEVFQAEAAAAYTGLASAVDRSLKESLGESARLAGASIGPAVEAALAGIARETAGLQARLGTAMAHQIETLSARFEAAQAAAVAGWESASTAAADQWEAANTQAASGWQAATGTAAAGWTAASATADAAWRAAVDRHEHSSQRLIEAVDGALGRFAATFEERSALLLADVARSQAEGREAMGGTLAGLARETATLHEGLAEGAASRLASAATRFEAAADRVTTGWDAALERQAEASRQAATDARAALLAASASLGEQAAAVLHAIASSNAEMQSAAQARDGERLAAMVDAIGGLGAGLRLDWEQAGEQALERQQAVCETLAGTARAVTTQVETQARATIAEIGRLVETAAEAPRAAADVIVELRGKLSDSMVRDNALLDERARVLQTLGTLLETVQQAAFEQRGAIDALVASSASLLDRVGERFGAQVDAQAGRLEEVAAQVTGSAVEVASLGEAFGAAVQQFAASNDTLAAHLERVDVSLGQSLVRSDEQLAYYVAQAREVIDLSILSQQRILEDLQRLAGRERVGEGEDRTRVAA